MSEPRRLVDEGSSELELELLQSARFDAPSPQARRRAMVALGVGGAVGASATIAGTTAAAGATATATAAGASATAATGAGLLVLKWVGIGAIAGLVTAGGIDQAMQARQPRPAAAAVTRTAEPGTRAESTGGALGASGKPAAPASEPTLDDAPAPRDEPGPRDAKPAPAAKATSAPSAPAAPPLADEVAALDRAREALAGGDAAAALRQLEQHDRRFSSGALGPEAMVLRIEATSARGDAAAAARLGREFLAANPQSPHAARVRSIVAAAGAP